MDRPIHEGCSAASLPVRSDHSNEIEEVWLHGNVRPVVMLVVIDACATAAIVTWLLLAAPVMAIVTVALAVLGAAALAVALLGWAVSRPRLGRRGRFAVVQLGPLHREDVPLELIECFFLGSSKVGRGVADGVGDGSTEDATDKPREARRRGTLVVRIAERAVGYRDRPGIRPWGTWSHGAIVFDGLWCEPLSAELIRRLSGRLIDARREEDAKAARA